MYTSANHVLSSTMHAAIFFLDSFSRAAAWNRMKGEIETLFTKEKVRLLLSNLLPRLSAFYVSHLTPFSTFSAALLPHFTNGIKHKNFIFLPEIQILNFVAIESNFKSLWNFVHELVSWVCFIILQHLRVKCDKLHKEI